MGVNSWNAHAETRSADIANPRGCIHLQLAMAFAQQIFHGAKVLLVHRDMLLELRTEPHVSRSRRISPRKRGGAGDRRPTGHTGGNCLVIPTVLLVIEEGEEKD